MDVVEIINGRNKREVKLNICESKYKNLKVNWIRLRSAS